MRSISVLIAFLFLFATTSYALPGSSPWDFPTIYSRKDGNDTDTSPEHMLKKECKEIRKLTKLTSLASNQTKIDELVANGKMTAAEVTELQAKAANATTTLQSLQSNATLVTECNVINAHRMDVKQCHKMQRLARLAELAGNQTALDEFSGKKGMNETRLEEKATEAEAKLKEMETNTTLTEFCTQRKDEKGDGDDDNNDVPASASESGTTADAVQEVAKSSAATLQALSYLCAPALAGVFVVFM